MSYVPRSLSEREEFCWLIVRALAMFERSHPMATRHVTYGRAPATGF